MQPDTYLGHYRIIRLLGKGGMGEVYLAFDTRLEREVALKLLPDHLRSTPDRLERFRREAKAAASLKHPNIATIYAIEECEGPDGTPLMFITMEYVDGVSLKELIPDGGMSIGVDGNRGKGKGASRTALTMTFFDIFIPLADALAHAHDEGRIHRDLKPANIMITRDGVPKILDFGLARIISGDVIPGQESPPSNDPDDETRTMSDEEQRRMAEAAMGGMPSLTQGGQFIGTPQYMSPEQAERIETDPRTDLFSFGVVMYEAVTGQRPFNGSSVESIVGKIIEAEPQAIPALKQDAPYTLWSVIRRCLKKDRDRRTQTARTLHEELKDVQQEIQSGTILIDASHANNAERSTSYRSFYAIGIALLLVAIAGPLAYFFRPTTEPEPRLRRFTIPIEASITNFDGPVLSPDGTMIAYTRSPQAPLRIHNLQNGTDRELEGTDNADRPFWSPDSKLLGYFEGAWGGNATIRIVPITGGVSRPIGNLPGNWFPREATWVPDNQIIFGAASLLNEHGSGSLYTVSAGGGTPEPFLVPDSMELGIMFPHMLPDGQTLLFSLTTIDTIGTITALSEGKRTTIVQHPGDILATPVYSPSGHIVYQRGFSVSDLASANYSSVWAVPFDAERLIPTGDPFLVADKHKTPSVSNDGTLLYSATGSGGITGQLVWVDRTGEVESTIGQPGNEIWYPTLSPIGRKIAASVQSDIWIYDANRGNRNRLTSHSATDSHLAWSPDGKQVAFTSFRSGISDIFLQAADGTGEPEVMVDGPLREAATDWSRNGRYILYYAHESDARRNLWYVPIEGSRTPVRIMDQSSNERSAVFSPDGKYIAYQSNASGRDEIYVTTFPSAEGREQVSIGGGSYPRWHPTQDELFYVNDNTLMVVSVNLGDSFTSGIPQVLFSGDTFNLILQDFSGRGYDVAPDGRFVVVQRVETGADDKPKITLIQDWAVAFEKAED